MTLLIGGLAFWLFVVVWVVCLCAVSKPTPEQREAIRRAHGDWTGK